MRAAVGRRNCLLHGTTYPLSILVANQIDLPWYGDRVVSFTRAASVSVRFATLFRDDSEERGAVLVLDKDSLRTRYRVGFANYPHSGTPGVKGGEFEECIGVPVKNLRRHLIAVVWGPRDWS